MGRKSNKKKVSKKYNKKTNRISVKKFGSNKIKKSESSNYIIPIILASGIILYFVMNKDQSLINLVVNSIEANKIRPTTSEKSKENIKENWLNSNKLREIKIPGDGNCLFSSLTKAVNHISRGNHCNNLRALLVNYATNNRYILDPNHIRGLLYDIHPKNLKINGGDINKEDIQYLSDKVVVDNWLDKMRIEGEFGDEMILTLFVDYFNHNYNIIIYDLSTSDINTQRNNDSQTIYDNTIVLLFNSEAKHYDVAVKQILQ